MFKITQKRILNANTVYMAFDAPRIAKKALPGQFIMVRNDDNGERVPFTVADYDRESGELAIIFQTVGKSSMQLADKNAGDCIADIVGPLGHPSPLEGYKKACVVAGGLGCAICYPQAKYLRSLGTDVDIVAGFRNSGLFILEDEMRAVADNLVLMTDDGSNGNKGLVTDGLKKLIDSGAKYDIVIAIGPPIMMKFVCKLTKEYGIKTLVSLNPIMIDGTGMCGCCRVTVDGKMKFACVDGPDFDGHLVDFDSLMSRNAMYREEEAHDCNLYKAAREAEENAKHAN